MQQILKVEHFGKDKILEKTRNNRGRVVATILIDSKKFKSLDLRNYEIYYKNCVIIKDVFYSLYRCYDEGLLNIFFLKHSEIISILNMCPKENTTPKIHERGVLD